MAFSKDKLLKKGNESLAIGSLAALGSVACPCPICIGSAALFILNGIREKIL